MPVTDGAGLRAAAEAWLADDPDPATRAELRAVLDAAAAGHPGAAADLADRFAGPLTFGTAGLRGAGRAGPLVVGYDGRHGSAGFATETASVCTGAGRRALVLPGPLPTPVLAYAVRSLGAAAGVMVTASHNPPADNGYKVYLADGAQLVPPADREIEAAIRAVGPLAAVPLGLPGEVLGPDVLDGYLDAVAALVDPASPRGLVTVATALHGVGAPVLGEALRRAGFAPPVQVSAQERPDPDFPTVAFPNPEEPGAVDLLLDLARERGADLAVANDPDADRCAVALPAPDTDGGWRLLTGDELGVLLADHLLRRGVRGTYATTIVSSALLRSVAERAAVPYAETLTGFKWIVRADEQTGEPLAYGYEEALGYAAAPGLVRDKDGISAAVLVAEAAARAGASGRTLLDRLDELAREHGVHSTGQATVRVDDLARITAALSRLRAGLAAAQPATLLGRPVTAREDLLAVGPAEDVAGGVRHRTDAVVLRAEGVRVVVRPSGTEPKLKAYLEVVVPVGPSPGEPSPGGPSLVGAAPGDLAAARAEAAALIDALRTEVHALLAV